MIIEISFVKLSIKAVGMDPGCKENIKNTAFGAGIDGVISAILPLGHSLRIIETHLPMVWLALLSLKKHKK